MKGREHPPLPPRRLRPWLLALLIPLGPLIAFWLFRSNRAVMNFLIDHVTTPFKQGVSALVDPLPFSMAEVLWTSAVVGGLLYLLRTLWLLLRRPQRLRRLLRRIAGLLAAVMMIYCGYTLLWGMNYYGDTFSIQSGLERRGATAEELYVLTLAFVDKANELADQMERDENGVFAVSEEEIFSRSQGLYQGIVNEFPCLEAPERNPKPIILSRLMSYLGFTGFFFPFTGEATVNVDSPAALRPSTIAHELSHQRNVTDEDEANFVAIMACLRSGDPVYQYSGCLLAFTHLGNALHKAAPDLYAQAYSTLGEEVLADLAYQRAYWAEILTSKPGRAANKAANAVYSSFTASYGETDVLQRYEACVELLVAYYFDYERTQ